MVDPGETKMFSASRFFTEWLADADADLGLGNLMFNEVAPSRSRSASSSACHLLWEWARLIMLMLPESVAQRVRWHASIYLCTAYVADASSAPLAIIGRGGQTRERGRKNGKEVIIVILHIFIVCLQTPLDPSCHSFSSSVPAPTPL